MRLNSLYAILSAVEKLFEAEEADEGDIWELPQPQVQTYAVRRISHLDRIFGAGEPDGQQRNGQKGIQAARSPPVQQTPEHLNIIVIIIVSV